MKPGQAGRPALTRSLTPLEASQSIFGAGILTYALLGNFPQGRTTALLLTTLGLTLILYILQTKKKTSTQPHDSP